MLKGLYGEDESSPFRIKDLWAPSIFDVGSSGVSGGTLEFRALNDRLGQIPSLKTSNLRLPDLETFSYGALEDISAPESLPASDLEDLQLPADVEDYGEDEDIWLTQEELPATKPGPRSWERFNDPDYREPDCYYLSEAGPLAFNAVLQQVSGTSIKVVQSAPFLKSLFMLGLGRESLFFEYDESSSTFKPCFPNVVLPGLSSQATDHVVLEISKTGSGVRALESFIQRSYQSSRSSPTKIAIAQSVLEILGALREEVTHAIPSLESVLQLMKEFERVSSVVENALKITENVGSLRNQVRILSKIYDSTLECEFGDPWILPLMQEILKRVSVPWLDFIGANLGLQSAEKVDKAQRKMLLEYVSDTIEGVFESDVLDIIPSFFNDHDRDSILQTCSSLELLREHWADHILSLSGRNQFTTGPPLEWRFHWTDLELTQTNASDYERRIRAAFKAKLNYTSTPALEDSIDSDLFNPYGKSDSELRRKFNSESLFNQIPPIEAHRATDPLRRYLKNMLRPHSANDDTFEFPPPLSLVPTLSFGPTLSIQSKLVNHACLKMLFEKFDLKEHLSIQHTFQLLGSGLFSTRLSESLFSSELSSAERRKGHARSGDLGLRLMARDTWPPATSELQLALAGILVDSYNEVLEISASGNSTRAGSGPSAGSVASLPGDLSFAVRNLSETEIQACLDRRSLYALDFLRLQYRPTSPLDSVLTSSSLDKYDLIFKFLLRILRLQFIIQQLSSQAVLHSGHRNNPSRLETRFRVEATHFVLAIVDYFFNSAIAVTWKKFWDQIVDMDDRLKSSDGFDVLNEGETIQKLRKTHDMMLDDMLFGLLLRKRQKAVMALLEKIFGIVLEFATITEQDEPVDYEQLQKLYKDFSKNMVVFVTVCKGLGAKSDYGPGGSTTSENTIEQLVLRLDINGWYDKKITHI